MGQRRQMWIALVAVIALVIGGLAALRFLVSPVIAWIFRDFTLYW